jgi:hypothetical protein
MEGPKMNINRRRNGRLIRRNGRLAALVAKLDMAWRLQHQPEGRLANQLAFELGNASRAGLYEVSRKIQCYNAAQLGQSSGWEQYL